jgi:glutaredoxin
MSAANDWVVLTREDCPLCDEFKNQVLELFRSIPAARDWPLREQSVEDDPILKRRYALSVPVLLLNGEKVAQAPLDVNGFTQMVVRLIPT